MVQNYLLQSEASDGWRLGESQGDLDKIIVSLGPLEEMAIPVK
jgi:hypothetical protein